MFKQVGYLKITDDMRNGYGIRQEIQHLPIFLLNSTKIIFYLLFWFIVLLFRI